MRVVAIRREPRLDHRRRGRRDLLPGDVLFLRGSPAGIPRLRELAAAPALGAADAARGRHAHRPRPGRRRAGRDEEHLRGGRRPGLLGAGAARPGPGRRGPPPRGPARRDEGPARAVGAAGRAPTTSTRRRCGACCTCPRRPRTSATRPSRWCGSSRRRRSCTRSSAIALGETDEVVVRVPVAAGSPADGATPRTSCSSTSSPGFHVLAVRRGGRYLYRPRGHVRAATPATSSSPAGPTRATRCSPPACGWRLDGGRGHGPGATRAPGRRRLTSGR